MKNSVFWNPTALANHEFQNPTMLIAPIVPWGGMLLMHGPRTAGKTQLALSLAAATAVGSRWLDTYVCERARTAYIEVDMSAQLLQSRVRQALGKLDAVAFFTSESFDIANFSSHNDKAFAALCAYDPQLLFVDSLRKTHRLDENDSNTAAKVYGRWRELFPQAALCFLHHDRKVPLGPFAGDPDEAFRGSSAWLDDVDTGLHLQRDKKTKRHAATLTFSKIRTTENQEPIAITLDPTTLLAIPGTETARTALLGYLAAHPGLKLKEAVSWLVVEGFCGKSFAYDLARELGLEKT